MNTPIQETNGELSSPDPIARLFAADALATTGPAEMNASLLKGLTDNNPDVRSFAARAMRNVADGRGLDPLIKCLDAPHWHVRAHAAFVLREHPERLPVAAWMDISVDHVAHIRAMAVSALDGLAKKQGVHPLMQLEHMLPALTSKNERVRRIAAEALGRIGDPKACDPLIEALEDGDSQVRHAAVASLGKIGDPRAITPLINILWHKDEQTRKLASGTLDEIGRKQVIHPLMQLEHMLPALTSKNEQVRRTAAESLGKIGDARAIAPLIKALGKERDADAAWMIAESLQKFNEPFAPYALHQINTNRKFDNLFQSLLQKLTPIARSSLDLADKSPVCSHCLTRFVTHAIKLGFMKKYRFFACRRCGLMGHRMENIKTIVAVIDNPWPEKAYMRGDTIYINLHMHGFKNLFDFNLVEIRNAPEMDPDETIARLIQAVAHDDRMTLEDLRGIPVQLAANAGIKQNTVNAVGFRFKGLIR